MAEAITRRLPAPDDQKAGANARARVDAALAAHADSVVAAVALLQALQDRGLLDLFRGLATQGDELLGVLAGLMARSGYADGLQTVFALMQGLGRLDAGDLADFMQAAAVGMREARSAASDSRTLGVFDLLAQLKDPDVGVALTASVAFLKGMGSALRGGAGDDGRD